MFRIAKVTDDTTCYELSCLSTSSFKVTRCLKFP